MVPSERLDQAFAMARELHKDQYRKNIPTPFISHPMTVASLVLENSDDEDLVIIALLHDVVEDAGGLPTLARVRAQFGDRIADGVLWLTDSTDRIDNLEGDAKRDDKRKRNLNYIQKMLECPEEVLIISCSDKIANLRSMAADYLMLGNEIWTQYSLSPDETVANYVNLLSVYRERLKNHRIVLLMAQALQAVCEMLNAYHDAQKENSDNN